MENFSRLVSKDITTFKEVIELFYNWIETNFKDDIEIKTNKVMDENKNLIYTFNQKNGVKSDKNIKYNDLGLLCSYLSLYFKKLNVNIPIFYIVHATDMYHKYGDLIFYSSNEINSEWYDLDNSRLVFSDEKLIELFVNRIDNDVLNMIQNINYDPFNR